MEHRGMPLDKYHYYLFVDVMEKWSSMGGILQIREKSLLGQFIHNL